ncbi:MAG: sigma-70 family RNA polymerase sigma factor [Thermoguttaceae bacterium]|nr:sigma-70 family RNA polymerase sigma factor [Thermoguttaceae bacterium]
MNDEELIDKTLSGDKNAFGKLAQKYQDRVYNLALSIVGNSEDAMDVAQETFLQALAHLDKFRKSSSFYTWLYRIAYNGAVGLLRRRKKVASLDRLVEEAGVFCEARSESPDANVRREDDVATLREALAKLPDEYRQSIILREIDGLNYEEIAETLKIPTGTVRSRLHRARQALRESLGRRLGD